MIYRIRFLLICLLACSKLSAQEANEIPLSGEQALADLTVENPRIESILANEKVHKLQKSRNLIQATGFREGEEKHFVIHFSGKQLHGAWQSFFENNRPCDSGGFKKNLPDGEWKTWYENGQLKSVRNYSAEKYKYIKADIKRNHPKDQRYQLTHYAKTGFNIALYFRPIYQQRIVNTDLPLLEKIKWNTEKDNASYIPPYSNCLHHGAFINYFENGLVKDSGHYVNGLKHDLWTESNEVGQRAFGFYQHGLKHGQWKYYDANDELVYTEDYKHGKQTSSHYFRK